MNRTHRVPAALTVAVVAVIGCGQLSGAPTGGAGQSTSPSPATAPSVAPSVEPSVAATAAKEAPPPVEFTGRIMCGPPVSPDRAGTEETLDVGDDGMTLTRSRGGAWHQTVTMSDPRLEGTVYHTFEGDEYLVAGAEQGAGVWAATRRIENEEGAWETRDVGGNFSDGSPIGAPEFEAPAVYVGEGAYDGMIAIMESILLDGACGADVRGVLFGDGPVPEPYNPG
jgi:hypothetical protein